MQPLSDHLASATQRNGALLQRLVVRLHRRTSNVTLQAAEPKQLSGCRYAAGGDNRTHWFMENLLHQQPDDFSRRRQDGGFVLRLAGFQDGGEGDPAVCQVLAHAEEEAVQMVAQLDGLTEG